jgi:VWFA-related protein
VRSLTPVVVAALLALPLGAGAADEQAVALIATDAAGHFVGDLARDEVLVFENGEPREVVRFERDERKLDLALVVDSSDGATRSFRVHAYEDLAAFHALLPEGTRCTVWATGERPRRVGELKGDPAKDEKVVAQIFGFGGTNTLLDTLVDAAERLARSSGRRRAIVAISGASAGNTSWTPREVMGRVGQARAAVFGVQFREGSGGPAGPGAGNQRRDPSSLTMVGSSDHERILTGLSRSTGGRFESTSAALGVGPLLEAYARELAGQYRLRYVTVPTKGQRKVEVRVTRPGVRWRLTVDAP